MNHKFDVMLITIGGECVQCKQYLQTRRAISKRELEQDNLLESGRSSIIVHKLGEAYIELDKHQCSA